MHKLIWVLRLVAAGIMVQTLYFKFSGAEESIYIFNKVGLGDLGRYGSGVSELIAAILLLTPKWTKLGSLLTLGVMSGAIMSHLTLLGIEVLGDGGLLFSLALITSICAAANLVLTKEKISLYFITV